MASGGGEISKRIEAIQEDTEGAVKAIKDVTTTIHQINELQNTIASSVEEQAVYNKSDYAKYWRCIERNWRNCENGSRGSRCFKADLRRCSYDRKCRRGSLPKIASELRSSVETFRI